jgi:hypothetical protein
MLSFLARRSLAFSLNENSLGAAPAGAANSAKANAEKMDKRCDTFLDFGIINAPQT